MHKSLATNLIAGGVFLAAYFSPEFPGRIVLASAGLFALSGALTNWLAVHMLFERVPGLYGSGVIPRRFEEFKAGIRALIVNNFFTQESFARVTEEAIPAHIPAEWVLERIDFDGLFDGLVSDLQGSSLGGMLKMFGGGKMLEQLRAPFIAVCRKRFGRVVENIDVRAIVLQHEDFGRFRERIEAMIDHRLAELTPELVKAIVSKMIRQHLGWLVVWGGVFGGLLGVLSGLLVQL